MIANDWKEKLAAAAGMQDDEAVEQAFMEQAYVAVGNRDKELMNDPYMLGFEIVEKNDENNRLVGAFAFRCAGEILLAPVFFLNGQIKGAELLYRKGVGRFVSNTTDWVSYLKSREEERQGRAVPRSVGAGGAGSPMQLHMDRLSYPGGGAYKLAAGTISDTWRPEGSDLEIGEITKLWNEFSDREKFACLADGARSDGLTAAALSAGDEVVKVASEIARAVPAIADAIAAGGLLKDRVEKQASSEKETGWRVRFSGFTDDVMWKRGYEVIGPADRSHRYEVVLDKDESFSSRAFSGPGAVLDSQGNPVEVVAGPMAELDENGIRPAEVARVESTHEPSTSYGSGRLYYYVTKGSDKGRVFDCRSGDAGAVPLAAEEGGLDKDKPSGEKPKKGGLYLLWDPDNEVFLQEPLLVSEVTTTDGVLVLNGKSVHYWRSPRAVVRKDVESPSCTPKGTLVLPERIVFLPCDQAVDDDGKKSGRTVPPDAGFLTLNGVDKYVSKNKKASVLVSFDPAHDSFLVKSASGSADGLAPYGAEIVLARDFGISGADAALLVDKAREAGPVTASIVDLPGKEKEAGARWLDEDISFEPSAEDGDLGVPVVYPDDDVLVVDSSRTAQGPPASRWGDAHDPGRGYKDIGHIPDEDILSMANPSAELAQLGVDLGLPKLMDHGAVGSLLRLSDVKSVINEYVGKLEEALDYLGRMIFLLHWKPKGFADLYGTDDMPDMENKLVGVFTDYGDLVLQFLRNNREVGGQ